MPGRAISNVYFARPVTLSGASRRWTRVPITVGLAGQLKSSLATLRPFHTGNSFEDTGKSAAAADVSVEPFLDLFRRRIRMLFEQADAGHDESRRAEPAH